MPARKILWGTNYENELLPGELYNIVTDREPRDGSEFVQGASGIEDSWITGFDYVMDAEARFVPDLPGGSVSPISGPLGWQDFMDWARAKNPFRFVPDASLPDFYVDGCYLVEPMRGLGGLGTDIKRRISLKIRSANQDFHQALRGLMFEYQAGMSLLSPLATFVRATAATRRGLPGALTTSIGASDLSGVLRDRHYEGTLRTALLEAARIQICPNPEDLSAWAVSGTPIRTGGQADPFGGTNAWLIQDDDAAAFEYIISTGDIAFTDGVRAFGVFCKQGSASIQWFRLSGATERHRVRVTWSGGVPTLSTQSGSGTLFPPVNFGGGWWLCLANANGVLAADTNTIQMGPGSDGAVSDTGTSYFFGANAWDATFPSSYQGPSLGTRNVDQLAWSFPYKPQPMFLLVDFIENEPPTFADTRILTICGDNENTQRLLIYPPAATDQYTIRHDPSAVGFVNATIDKNTVRGDRMQVLGLLYADGSVKIGATKNGDAEAFSGQSAAAPLASQWSAQILGLGGRAGGGQLTGFRAFSRVKVGPMVFNGVTRDTIAKALLV